MPPFSIVTPPRKNQKNQNKNSGKNMKNQKTTTVRPRTQMTLTTQQQFFVNKSRKYDLSGYLAGFKTTLRPKIGMFEVKTGSGDINLDGIGGADNKYHYDKVAVKAPKQVKNNAFTTVIADIELFDRIHTINPNIPKMFQKYDKIQEVYPEFHPYVAPPKSGTIVPTQRPLYSSVNGKPSRENSKSLFFTDSLAQYMSSSNGMTSKKSSSSLSSQQMRTPNSRLSTNGQINRKG